MGRAFEYRKATKMKRWANMAKTFTKVGREIALAVRDGGPDPKYNSRLRLAMNNAKAANMPKANVESAIKKASSKEMDNFQEIVYEGYGPYGIPIIVETQTDNPVRTVANIRMYFNRGGGALGTSGSVDYMFSRKGVFKFKSEGVNIDELELELIDHGLEELKLEDDEVVAYCTFEDFGSLQKAIEDKNIEISNAELQRIPNVAKEVTDEQAEEVIKLIDRIEEDDDVMNVFHGMDMSE